MSQAKPSLPDPNALPAPDDHLTTDLLSLVFVGALPAETLVWPLLDHVQASCSDCAQVLEEFSEQLAAADPESRDRYCGGHEPADYRAAFRAALASAGAAAGQRISGRQVAGELSALPAEERYGRLCADPGISTPPLCLHLIEEARRISARDLAGAEELVHFELAVAGRLDARRYPAGLIRDCQAEGWALLGEIRAAEADEIGADLAFRNAESLLAAGSGDPLSVARVHSGRATLLRRQGDLDGCLAELSRAGDLYGAAGDPHVQGRTLLQRGLLLQELGRLAEAREVIGAGIGLLDAQRDRELADLGRAALLDSLDSTEGSPESPGGPH